MALAIIANGEHWNRQGSHSIRRCEHGSDTMNVSVILCTYNRRHKLAEALKSVAASQMPDPIQWEVLIVDNNSSDGTRAVAQNFCMQYPQRFRYVFEGKPGKSNALNSGIIESQGHILAFMDDDVKVEPSWLQNLTAALHDGQYAGAGGRILPAWEAPPPRWLSLEGPYAVLGATLACFDLGDEPVDLKEAPYGTNMAFRREMFEKYGNFRTDLGPRPENEIRNEDTEFGHRLLAAGEKLRYEPFAVVHHEVPESRAQKQYFLRWWFDKGRADIRQFGVPQTKWQFRGVPLFLFRRLMVWTLKWITVFEPCKRFDRKINVWIKMGEISECYRRFASARIQPNTLPDKKVQTRNSWV